MAKVKALYSYTYEYEGTKITFTCGDEFQLLAKVNNDWWHVRRWVTDGSQDMYVPAVYVKEVGEEPNPLYQNMSDIKRQVEAFKKKESSTPPPPTARKPKHDRVGSEKIKAVHRQDKPLGSDPPAEHKESSVADRAKKLVENLQAKRNDEEFPIPRTESGGSPLVMPKRSHSSRRDEGSNSPRSVHRLHESGALGPNMLAMTSKPRSHSINARPGEKRGEKREEKSASPTEMQRAESPAGVKSATTPAKTKLPPPVLPKGGKLNRPKSMVMFSPTEGPGGENPFSSALNNKLVEQMKKRSASNVGATTSTAIVSVKDEQTISPVNEGRSLPMAANGKPMQNGALPQDTASTVVPSPSTFLAPKQYVLPDGWTEHKTNEGHTYYYHVASGKSSWTRPPSSKTTPTTSPAHHLNGRPSNPLEKVAPKGWTKEINTLSQTPIYTNSRSGERWALAKDATGNFYYYNLANSSLTVGELPDIADMSSSTSSTQPKSQVENIYDHIGPAMTGPESRPRTNSDPRAKPDSTTPISPSRSQPSPSRSQPSHSTSTGGLLSAQLEVFHHSLAHLQLKKHGYLLRKKLFDAQGKRVKGGWQKVYISLDNFQLRFFTDHKVAMETGAKPLSLFHLLQATVCTYTKERKIKYAFLVCSPFGEQFLLQADAIAQMNDWYSTIQTAVHKANDDYRLHPDKYCDVFPEGDGEISPKTQLGKQHRKPSSKDIGGLDEDDDLDDMESVSDKSDRIRSRLRRLMARRPQIETLQKKGIIQDPVFGADLAKLCEREKTQMPQFLIQFMEHIERVGMDTVGLYRLSGNMASVQKLRCLVEQDDEFDLNDPEWADINIVTSCLKLYFRELPDPLIPANSFKAFIDAARLAPTPAQRITALAAQVQDLPKVNYHILNTLIQHLRRVVDNGSVNKMHSQNVSIVFGPTLSRAEGDPFEMAKLTPVQNGIVELMLIEYDKIFTTKK